MVQRRAHKTMYPVADPVALGHRIRLAREQRGWTRTDLAIAANRLLHQAYPERATIPERWIERLERGEVPSLDLERITYVAEILGLSLAEIVTHPLPFMVTPQMTPAELVLSLRNFGLDNTAVDAVLEYAIHWKKKQSGEPK